MLRFRILSGAVLIDIGLVLLCLCWTVIAGKDLNWDLRNYHYYLPYSMAENRLSKDFLPASIQSYLNPISYFPFYWMVKADWSAILISMILAGIHSMNLLILRRITGEIFTSPSIGALAFILSVLAPIYWVEVGTSFNDVIVSVFVLGGVYWALKSLSVGRFAGGVELFAAGLLLGSATALKITAAPFALSAVIFVLLGRKGVRDWPIRSAGLLIGGLIGALLFGGYWFLSLWREFGNPVFPFFNRVFCSPDFLCESISASRFLPSTLVAAAILPFEIATPVSWVYTETTSPDIRYAAICFALFLLCIFWIFSRRHREFLKIKFEQSRAGFALVAYFVLFYLFWCLTSANGRYAIPMGLLAGLVIAEVASWATVRYFRIVIGVVIALQCAQLFMMADARWSPSEWSGTWFDMEVPEKLAEQPYLYLSIGQQSNSFIAPFVHQDSAFVNLIGQTSLSSTSFGYERLHGLLHQYQGRVRTISAIGPKLMISGRPNEEYAKEINVLLSSMGLIMATDDCVTLSSAAASNFKEIEVNRYVVLSCAVVAAPIQGTNATDARELIAAASIMDKIEAACPNLFNPKGVVTERTIRGFRRYYVGTEINLQISHLGQVYMSKVRVPNDYDFGTVEDWRTATLESRNCPRHRRSPPWFSVSDPLPLEF